MVYIFKIRSPKLEIDPQKWALGTPMGEISKFYKRCRVDFYGPYVQVDGLIERAAYYEDYKRLRVKEIRYFYYASKISNFRIR